MAVKKTKPRDVIGGDYKNRVIWLNGILNPDVGVKFQKILAKMNSQGPDEISMLISGPGGHFHTCMDMISMIGRSGSKITAIIFGTVASAVFLLTQAKFKKRIAVVGTSFGFHRGRHKFGKDDENLVFTQELYEQQLREIALINATQLIYFTASGASSEAIYKMLSIQAVIDTGIAKKLYLVDGLMQRKTFKCYESIMRQGGR